MSAKHTSKSKASKVFWRWFISIVGVILILIALSEVVLGFIGDTAVANVSTRRTGYADTGAPPNRQYEWSIDYSFNVNGKKYNGTTSAKGNAMSVEHGNIVYYYSFAPFINSINAKDVPGIFNFIMIGLGILLLVVMNKSNKKSKKQKKKEKLSAYNNKIQEKNIIEKGINERCGEKVTMAWLMENQTEYDDSIEEYYQNGWDENDPSWQCSCGKWNEGDYCINCSFPKPK